MSRMLAIGATVLALSVPASAATVGALTQLGAPNGCLMDTGSPSATCTSAHGLAGVEALKLSPDGMSLYSYSFGSGAVGVFARDPLTGQISQLAGTAGCLQSSGLSGACTDTRGPSASTNLDNIAVTPNGQFVYVAGEASPSMVSAFSRNTTTGALTELAGTAGCVSSNGNDAGSVSSCLTYANLIHPNAVAVSPDGKNLYVTLEDTNSGMAVFSIAANGSLSAVQCINPVAAGGCAVFAPLKEPGGVIVSPDGKNVYAAGDSSSALAVFSRDGTTGALNPLAGTSGCVSADGSGGACAHGLGLENPYALAISPGGENVYEASLGTATAGVGGYLTAFSRDASTGALSQLPGTAGCFSANGANQTTANACTPARSMGLAYDLDVSPDGHTVYQATYNGNALPAAGYPGFAIFNRAADGSLAQLGGTAGCITSDGTSDASGNPCATDSAASGPVGVEISPDGAFVYGAAYGSDALSIFSRAMPSAPSCSAGTVNVGHDTAAAVPLTCSDADGDPITRSIAGAPAHGTLGTIDQSGGTVSFTPTAGFSGDDSFTFKGTDRDGSSAAAAVTLHVAAAPTVTPPADTTPPRGKVGKVKTTLRKLRASGKMTVPVTSDEACRVGLKLMLGRKQIGSGSGTIAAPGSKRLTLRLSAKGRRALRKLHKAKLTLTVTLTDAAHNHSSARRKLALAR